MLGGERLHVGRDGSGRDGIEAHVVAAGVGQQYDERLAPPSKSYHRSSDHDSTPETDYSCAHARIATTTQLMAQNKQYSEPPMFHSHLPVTQ